MSPATIESTPATPATIEAPILDEAQLLNQEINALTEGQARFFHPPFDGDTVWRAYNPTFFESHHRQYRHRGEVVVQLGMRRNGYVVGRAEGVLWHNLRVGSSGSYRVVVRATAGPITVLHGARCSVRSFIGGVSGHGSSPIASYQNRYFSYRVDLEAGRNYRLFTLGSILIPGSTPTGPLPYGEVIVTFPQVTVFPSAIGLTDPFQEHIEQALASADSDEALTALAEELPRAALFGDAPNDGP